MFRAWTSLSPSASTRRMMGSILGLREGLFWMVSSSILEAFSGSSKTNYTYTVHNYRDTPLDRIRTPPYPAGEYEGGY
jgi:hypothetical protein